MGTAGLLVTPSPPPRPVRLDLQLKQVLEPTFCSHCRQELPFGEQAVAVVSTGAACGWHHLRCFALPPGHTTGTVLGLSPSSVVKAEVSRVLARARKVRRRLDLTSDERPHLPVPPPLPIEKKRKAARGVQGHRAAAEEMLAEPHPGDRRFILTPMGPTRDLQVLDKYGRMAGPGLADILRANAQLLGGTVAEKKMRCVDGELRGALPLCPWCRRGRIRLEDGGTYSCPGYFHLRTRTFIRCEFEATFVQRLCWAMPGGQVQSSPGVT